MNSDNKKMVDKFNGIYKVREECLSIMPCFACMRMSTHHLRCMPKGMELVGMGEEISI